MTEIARFELLRDERIAEINTRARLYRHSTPGRSCFSHRK